MALRPLPDRRRATARRESSIPRAREPRLVARQRHQRRPRPADRVAHRGEPGVAVAGRAATRITLAAGRDDQLLAAQSFASVVTTRNRSPPRSTFVTGSSRASSAPLRSQPSRAGRRAHRPPDRSAEKSCRPARLWSPALRRGTVRPARAARAPPAANAETSPAEPNAAMMPAASQSCVMLQRVPPDINIFTPGLRFFSTSSVRRPAFGTAGRGQQTRRPGADHDHRIVAGRVGQRES